MIPFVGRLELSNWEAWKKTTVQTLVSVVLSSAPIWISVTALLIDRDEPNLIFAISYAVKNGELLLLSASAVSPLLYLTATASKARSSGFFTSFPHGAFYLLFVAVVLLVCATFITLRTTNGHPASYTHNGSGAGSLFPWSLWLYGFSLFLYFTANFHKNSADNADAGSIIRPGEADFDKAWGAR